MENLNIIKFFTKFMNFCWKIKLNKSISWKHQSSLRLYNIKLASCKREKKVRKALEGYIKQSRLSASRVTSGISWQEHNIWRFFYLASLSLTNSYSPAYLYHTYNLNITLTWILQAARTLLWQYFFFKNIFFTLIEK